MTKFQSYNFINYAFFINYIHLITYKLSLSLSFLCTFHSLSLIQTILLFIHFSSNSSNYFSPSNLYLNPNKVLNYQWDEWGYKKQRVVLLNRQYTHLFLQFNVFLLSRGFLCEEERSFFIRKKNRPFFRGSIRRQKKKPFW